MKHGSTLFLKIVIYGLGLVVLALCVIFVGVSIAGNAGIALPILLIAPVAAVPFFYALRQGLLLLSYIDTNTAFSAQAVRAIKNIKNCAFTISVLYAASMPYFIYIAEKDDAPGVPLIALVLIFAPLTVSIFAAVLEKLLKNAIDIKSENDLTV